MLYIMQNTNILFIVTSVVYTTIQSVYTPNERYEQTINTIQSINKYVKNAHIIVVETSLIDQEIVFDNVIMFYMRYQKCGDKSINEAITIKSFLRTDFYKEFINKNNIDLVFKISGRYFLNEHFDITKFDYSRFASRLVDTKNDPNDSHYNPETDSIEPDYCHITQLFAFPSNKTDELCERMQYVLDNIGIKGVNIEHLIFQGLSDINNVDILGISGHIAPNGRLYHF